MSRLLDQLAALDRAHALEHKLLLGPDLNYGREVLRALARHAGGWLGWEPATLRSIADDLAFVPLAEAGRRAADDVDTSALLDRAFDACLADGLVSPTLAALGHKLGIRAAVRDAVLSLRTAGATPDMVRRVTERGSPAADLPVVMERFATLLAAAGLVDPGGVFECALAAFDDEAPLVLDGPVVTAPGLTPRGLAARLFERLGGRVHRLSPRPDDAPLLDPGVTPALFHAATVADEVREVLRRVVAEPGLGWDEVEVVATDPDAYGVVLHGLALRDDIPLTALSGVPMARTRTGRAVARALEWLEEGLPADLVREALQTGELGGAEGPALARALRRLGLGWGRSRYEDAARRLGDGSYVAGRSERHEDEDDETYLARRAAAEAEAGALAHLVGRLLSLLPPEVPERGSATVPRTTTAQLAAAALAWLEMAQLEGPAELRARERCLSRLRRLASVQGEPPRPFPVAMAALRESLADLRAWPLATEAGSPWSAAGGALHLTDLAHAGAAGRAHVFVVGLDADRVAGSRVQAPILGDTERGRLNALLGHEALPTTAGRAAERRALVREALGGLTGRVTLSYALAGDPQAGAAGPSWVMLEGLRCDPACAGAGYDDLRDRLGEPASPVPTGAALDERDVWLGELASGALLLDGRAAVRAAHPDLDRGLAALAAREGETITVHHGLMPGFAGRFDPVRAGRPISASSLQHLATCPLRWFYRYGLDLLPPDDVAYDPEVWLDAPDQGSLLHRVFERFVREFRERQGEVRDDELEPRLDAIVADEIGHWRTRVPPPGEAVFRAQSERILDLAHRFLGLEREQQAKRPGEWVDAELRFGRAPVTVEWVLADGRRLSLQGAVDRVDRLADGTLRVIDYKTGSAVGYTPSPNDPPLKGGRVLQAALYAHAAAALLGARVSTSEYWFPAGDRTAPYPDAELRSGPAVIASLLEHPLSGAFVPTTDADACGRCDYAPICRATRDRWGNTASPLAEWAAARAEELPEYRGFLARNAPRGGGRKR